MINFVQRARRLWAWLLVGCWLLVPPLTLLIHLYCVPALIFQPLGIYAIVYLLTCMSVYVSVVSSAPTTLFLCRGTCSLVVGGSPTLTLETAHPQSSSLGYTPELKLFLMLSVSDTLLQLGKALAHITARKHWDSTGFVPRTKLVLSKVAIVADNYNTKCWCAPDETKQDSEATE